MTEPLNRESSRWFGRTNRRWKSPDTGEDITARKHMTGSQDGIAIWKDEKSVGRSAGLIAWWEGGERTTLDQLQYLYESWNDAGRRKILGGVDE